MHPVEELVAVLVTKWRAEEETFRRRGQAALADFVQSICSDTAALAAAWLDEPLTLGEACEIGRYGYSHLQHMLREGQLPNAGEKHRPRVRRRDVPWKDASSHTATTVALQVKTGTDRDEDPVLVLLEEELLAMEKEGCDPDWNDPGSPIAD